jgi:hypothetical protein
MLAKSTAEAGVLYSVQAAARVDIVIDIVAAADIDEQRWELHVACCMMERDAAPEYSRKLC